MAERETGQGGLQASHIGQHLHASPIDRNGHPLLVTQWVSPDLCYAPGWGAKAWVWPGPRSGWPGRLCRSPGGMGDFRGGAHFVACALCPGRLERRCTEGCQGRRTVRGGRLVPPAPLPAACQQAELSVTCQGCRSRTSQGKAGDLGLGG